jgi:hypothetical protein
MTTLPESRGHKALALVASGALDTLIPVVDNEHFLIPSCSTEGASYITSTHQCSCNDFKYRGKVCKHQVALRLANVLKVCAED